MEAGLIRPVKVEARLTVLAIIGRAFLPWNRWTNVFQALGRNGINCVAIAQRL
jgi:hypothetical protein